MAMSVTYDPKLRSTQGATFVSSIDELESRLERGWILIEARLARDEPVEDLERHWLRLLSKYERLLSHSGVSNL